MENGTIRIVNTSAEDVAACNVEHLLRVFGEISRFPAKAKALRGLVFLGFPSTEGSDDWRNPLVRQFIRKLDREMPYFCYFLTAEVPFGFLRTYMYCLLDIGDDGSVQPKAFESLVRRLERETRVFCDRIADRPELTIERVMTNMPAAIVHNVPALRRAALRSLLPILEKMSSLPDAPASVKRLAFREAEELLGLTVSRSNSESAIVACVRAEVQTEG